MSVDSDFDEMVKICESHIGPWEAFDVDLENCIVFIGAREISPVRRGGLLVGYLVIEPSGLSHVEGDLDSYFQHIFEWENW